MKLFLSIDMEGTSGLANWKEPGERVRREMTLDLLAALKGAREGGAQEFLVCDSHGPGMNILPNDLPSGVTLIRGFPRPYYMMAGLRKDFDLVFFLGYHAPAGCSLAQMDHAFSSSSFYEIKVNGEPVGEAEVNAIYAAHLGIPVGLITGDEALYEFSSSRFPDEVEFVITKRGMSRFAAELYPQEEVRLKIEEKAKKVVQGYNNIPHLDMKPPFNLEIAMTDTLRADIVSMIPGVRREKGRRITYRARDGDELLRFITSVEIMAFSARVIGEQ